jgi:hypothetical protein
VPKDPSPFHYPVAHASQKKFNTRSVAPTIFRNDLSGDYVEGLYLGLTLLAGPAVMLFVMTLGMYSIIPSIYRWREVSTRLAVLLFVFFVALGWVMSMIF